MDNLACSLGDIWQCAMESFLVVTTVGGLLIASTRDAVNILYYTGHPYTTENELAPSISSAKAEKSASKETCFHSAPGPKGSSR